VIFLFKESLITESELRSGLGIHRGSKKVNYLTSFYVVLLSLIIIFFMTFSELSTYDALATPITERLYSWGVLKNSLLWVGISTISIIACFCINFTRKIMSDSSTLHVSMIIQIAGLAIMIGWTEQTPLWRFLVGTALLSFGFPIAQIELMSIYSQILGNMKQGLYMGMLTAGGALARMTSPIWCTEIFKVYGMDIVFLATCALMIIGELILLLLWATTALTKLIDRANSDYHQIN